MLHQVYIANIKNIIDSYGENAPRWQNESFVLQVSAGKGSAAEGWHFTVRNGNWTFHTGLYQGEIFIDWNDEYKYKDKSKKQIEQETTPDCEIHFRTRKDLDRWAEAAANTSADKIKAPKAKGRLNAAEKRCFQQLLCDAYHLQMSTFLTDREKETAARLLLYILPSVINICGKEGDRDIINFMDGSRRSYAFEVKNLPACSAWLTVAGGKGKITSGQGTKLPIYFSLAFDSPDEAIFYFHGTEDFRTEINRKAIHFCGADAYALRDQSRIEAERYAFEQMIRHVFRVI